MTGFGVRTHCPQRMSGQCYRAYGDGPDGTVIRGDNTSPAHAAQSSHPGRNASDPPASYENACTHRRGSGSSRHRHRSAAAAASRTVETRANVPTPRGGCPASAPTVPSSNGTRQTANSITPSALHPHRCTYVNVCRENRPMGVIVTLGRHSLWCTDINAVSPSKVSFSSRG